MLKKVKRIKLGQQAYRRLLKRVLERDGWRCQKCGALRDLQVHHRTYRSQQGNDSLANLVTLCAYCHMQEHGQLSFTKAAAKNASGPKQKEVRLRSVISIPPGSGRCPQQ
jgi:5-methylcytosine-specific restriction endonuclease McrA